MTREWPCVMSLRSRSPEGEPRTIDRDDWDNARIAVVICDMWDTTQCVSAAGRVTEMAPRINEVVARLRRDGALIVHAPAGCMDYYAGTPARERARQAARVPSPVPVEWNDWDASREARLPAALADDTACSCEPGDPCTQGGPPYPWRHQISLIEISSTDAVTDDGDELLALLEERNVEDVVVMGIHANRCVLGRPYGIRQLVYWNKRSVLCRDLTDSYHRHPRGHHWGNEQMIAHIERYWCPTLTSDQLLGGTPSILAGNHDSPVL
jgi:nicotinamidase-related amidase